VPPQPRGPPRASPGPGAAGPPPGFDGSLHWQQDIPQAKFLLKKARQENLTVTLDAYTDKIAGYSHDKAGESLSGWDFEHFWLVG
jgi:hypothetical protein